MTLDNFTYCGEASAEQVVKDILSKVATEIIGSIPSKISKSLILLGGYGKGEGGMIRRENSYIPHNNFDLLLVTSRNSLLSSSDIDERIQQKVRRLEKDLDIGIDISIMPEYKLRKMPTRVFSYDMKEGHRTLYGDSSIVPSIHREINDIPNWDMRNLMVNRGSLLLINQLCLDLLKNGLDKNNDIKKLIIKHTMKAIIGYGDAVLYFNNQYHWSYKVKNRRLLQMGGSNIEFARLYQEAMNFRFSPRYECYLDLDFNDWQKSILFTLQDVHLQCESKRLGIEINSWDTYFDASLRELPIEKGMNVKVFAKLLANSLRDHTGKLQEYHSPVAKLGYYSSSENTLIPLLFPLIAFIPISNSKKTDLEQFLKSHLGIMDSSNNELIKRYLSIWGEQFDKNLWSILKRYGIQLR